MKFYHLFLMTVLLANCAPKIEENNKKDPAVPSIQSNDLVLNQIYKSPFASLSFAHKKLVGKNNYNLSSNQSLFEIGRQLNDLNAFDQANLEYASVLKSMPLVKKSFDQSYYLQVVKESSEKQIYQSIGEVEKKIIQDTERIQNIIHQNVAFKDLSADNSIKQIASVVFERIRSAIQHIQEQNIFEDLKKQVVFELRNESQNYEKYFNTQIVALESSGTLSSTIQLIQTVIKERQFKIEDSDNVSLNQGQILGQKIDAIQSPETALQALAYTWQILNVEEREQLFKSANEKLYELFNKKDPEDIQCLIDNNCSGLISKLVLKLGVYPALKDYGIENLRDLLNTKSNALVHSKLQKIILGQIQNLNTFINETLQEKVTDNIDQLGDFKKNFISKISKGLGSRWGSVHYLTMAVDKNYQLSQDLNKSIVDLYSIDSKSDSISPIELFSLIEKNLSLYESALNKDLVLKKGLLKALKNPQAVFLKSTNSTKSVNITAQDQALALKYLSLMLNQTADWKKSVLDKDLTNIQVQDVVTDYQNKQFNVALFPKKDLFSLNLSMAVQILKQLEHENSLVYLINNKGQRVQISEYLKNISSEPVALAAVSDRIDNRLSNVTRAADISLMIQSFCLLAGSLKEIEKSQSDLIQDPDTIQQIRSALKNIDLLVITLSNFLTYHLVDKNYLVHEKYDFEFQKTSPNVLLENQVAAIHSMVLAYEQTGIGIYLDSALELYYALNKNFYDPQIKFYKNELNSNNVNDISKDSVLNSLNHLLSVRKYLPLSSQVQFDRLFENWYVAVLL